MVGGAASMSCQGALQAVSRSSFEVLERTRHNVPPGCLGQPRRFNLSVTVSPNNPQQPGFHLQGLC